MTYHYFYPHVGGLEESIYQLAKRLVKAGHKLTLITSNIGLNNNDLRPGFELIEGINVIRCKARPWLFRTIKLINFREKLKEIKPDIFHTHHPIPGVSDATVFYAKKYGYPCVVTYHADSQEDAFLNKICAKAYYFFIANEMVKNADKIIATTKTYAEASPVLKNVGHKIKIISYGVDTERFKPKLDENRIRDIYKIKNKIIIFALGRMVPYKGFSFLIKSMQYLDNRFVLVLGGDGILKDKLKKLVNDLRLEDRIFFTGFIPEMSKLDYFSACDIFVLPSITRGEAFGITVLEAMACGKPVVATDLPGLREIASIGGLLVPPKDPHRLAQAVKDALLKKKNSQDLYALIKEKFSWDTAAEEVMKIYQMITSH